MCLEMAEVAENGGRLGCRWLLSLLYTSIFSFIYLYFHFIMILILILTVMMIMILIIIILEIHQNQNRRDRLRKVIRTIILIWNIIFIIIIFIAYREEVNQKFFPQAYQKRPLTFTTPSISFTFLFLFLHFL